MTRREPLSYKWDTLEFDETILPRNYTEYVGKRKIDFVVLHHMVIPDRDIYKPDALDRCWSTWIDQGREASAHYGVEQTFVRQFVWDNNIAWANGNADANNRSISIEHANRNLTPNFPVAEKTWKTSALLVAHIHKFYNLGLPTLGKTVFLHKDFYPTACPGASLSTLAHGAYLREARRLYRQLVGDQPIEETPEKDPPLPNITTIAKEVIAGRWGNDPDRSVRLLKAGFEPTAVQAKVNEILGGA